MKKSIKSYLSVGLLGSLSLASCKKERTDVREMRLKEGPTIDIGPMIPELRDTRNDTVYAALYPSAVLYFIDLGLVQSENSMALIKEANKLDMPVRVKVYEDNFREIAEIYPATKEDIEKYRESQREWNN